MKSARAPLAVSDRLRGEPGDWAADPEGNQKRIAQTFREACSIARDYGEFLVAEGEVCWGGMHSWRRMIQLLEMVDQKGVLGFQADMAHTLCTCWAPMRLKTRCCLQVSTGRTPALDAACTALCDAPPPLDHGFPRGPE